MQRLLLPLLNIKFDDERIDVRDRLVLRKLLEEERDRWCHNPTVLRYVEPEELATATHVVEQTSDDLEPLPHQQAAGEYLFTLLALIELFMPERLRAPVFVYNLDVDNDSSTIYENRQSLLRHEMRYATYAKVAKPNLLTHWTLVTKDDDANRRLRRALGRYTLAREAYFAEEAILQATIGLECLFSPEHENGNTSVVAAGVVMWSHDPDVVTEPKSLADSYQSFKRDYNIRSLIVHGKIVKEEGLSDAATAMVNALRRCLLISLGKGVDGLDQERLYETFVAYCGEVLKQRGVTFPDRKKTT